MIEIIKIDDKEYPLRVSYYAIKRAKLEIQQKSGSDQDVSMSDIMSGDIELMEPLLFYGLEVAHKVVNPGEKFPFVREDAELLLDGCFFDFLKIMPKFFPEGLKKAGEQGLGKQKRPVKKK